MIRVTKAKRQRHKLCLFVKMIKNPPGIYSPLKIFENIAYVIAVLPMDNSRGCQIYQLSEIPHAHFNYPFLMNMPVFNFERNIA